MNTPPFALEVFLQPGEYFFGDKDTRVRTILGSCVSVTFWHPRKLIGGMCHIMLPTRKTLSKNKVELCGKYADEALTLLLAEMKNNGAAARDFQVKIFGGGDMFSNKHSKTSDTIGQKNIQMVKDLLNVNQFNINSEHIGGQGHRYIIFDVWSGDVWVRHHELTASNSELVTN